MQARLFAVEKPSNSIFLNLLEDKKIGSQPPLSELAFPILFNDDTIQFFFGDKVLTIEKSSGKLFLDGEIVCSGRHYLSPFCQKYNNSHGKIRVLKLFGENKTLLVDKGSDGRLFFLLFENSNFRRFRGEPFWKASFWFHDGKAEWFESDLHKPCMTELI